MEKTARKAGMRDAPEVSLILNVPKCVEEASAREKNLWTGEEPDLRGMEETGERRMASQRECIQFVMSLPLEGAMQVCMEPSA